MAYGSHWVADGVASANDRGRARLIITADDLGRDSICTRLIIESLEAGRIGSASIMANGACFEEACDLVHARGLSEKIGVHIALDEGPPLSERMRPYCRSDGSLSVRRTLAPLGRDYARAVEAECVAQVGRVIAAGIRPTHIDSHRHIHTVFPIGRLVLNTARRFAIRYVRPARNLLPTTNLVRAAYKWTFNQYVAFRVGTADYFGDIVDFFERGYSVREGSLIECMVHLDASERGQRCLRLFEDPEFQAFLLRYRLVTHADAGY